MTSQVLGDNIIQCQEISSSSDLFDRPFQSSFSFRGRPSYRRSSRMFISNQSPRHSPNIIEPYPFPNAPINNQHQNFNVSLRSTIAVMVIFLTAVLSIYLVYRTFPNVTEEEKQYIKVPFNKEDARNLGIMLNKYKTEHYYQVMAVVVLVYIFLQTFAIPGSSFLSVLSGFLFPFSVALFLVCACSTVGASLCFVLSQLLGKKLLLGLLLRFIPDMVRTWTAQVEKHRDNLLYYMVFLRVTPFFPNWFINLTAPVIGVPLYPFALGTFIGVAPPSFLAIQGGKTLHNMTASDSSFNPANFIWMLVFGVISLIPILLKNRLREKID